MENTTGPFTLAGSWRYRSFFSVVRTDPKSEQSLQVEPWSPPGTMTVTTNEEGEVAGKLSFAPGKELLITGNLIAPKLPRPAGVHLQGKGLGSVNELRGFFVSPDLLVGTIVCWSNDPAKQPDGTSGPFVLMKVE